MEDTPEKADQLREILNYCKVDLKEKLQPPLVCLQILNENGELSDIGTLGNFSMIIGKAKSRKTFSISLCVAATLNKSVLMNKIKGTLYNDKENVLYFDTEQGKHHVQKVAKRICKLHGIEYPENFLVYSLRKFTHPERLELIEFALYNTQNISLVIIDGFRDLLSSINDEQQATGLCENLLRWTDELNIHIIGVLHQNKNDLNARGHAGTELINKAETVLSVTKDPKNKNISIVEAVQCREIEFNPFAFEIDSDGLPQILEDWIPDLIGDTKKTAFKPESISDLLHYDFIKKTFEKQPEILPKEFKELIREFIKSLNKDNPTGDTKIKEFVTYYKINNWVSKIGHDKDGKAPFVKKEDVF